MKIKFWKFKTKGNTLLELLLYISMYAIIMLSVTGLLVTLLQLRVKNHAISEVDQQGVQIMQTITQAIRNSDAINSPTPGTNTQTLSLDVASAPEDPTVFSISNNVMQITEGAGSAIPLSNNLVTVSGLTFENLARPDTLGIVRVQFTVSFINNEGRNEYSYTKTFIGTASLK